MIERDKYLTEAMGGKVESGCMLDVSSTEDATLCVIDDPLYSANDCCFSEAGKTKETCGEWREFIVGGITDFSTWEGFGKLWNFVTIHQSRWEMAGHLVCGRSSVNGGKFLWLKEDLVNPDAFANAVYEFLKGRD